MTKRKLLLKAGVLHKRLSGALHTQPFLSRQSARLYIGALCFVFGIGYALLMPVSISHVALVLVICFALVLSSAQGMIRPNMGYAVAGMVTISCVGIVVFLIAQSFHTSGVLTRHVGQEHVFTGSVQSEPDVRDGNTRYVVSVTAIDGMVLTREECILVFANRYPELTYNSVVEISGALKLPEAFTSETSGRPFDYPMYLEKDSIGYVIYYPSITHIGYVEGNVLLKKLFDLKHVFLSSLQSEMREPHVSFLGGLLLGAKQSLGEDLLEAFRVTGVMHIVVLSGYNVSIIAYAILRSLSILPKKVAAASAIIAIGLFALMVGAGATVVRASIMAILAVIAGMVGRQYNMVRALLIAGLLMLVHNPYILFHDPSFQLSFLATLGLIVLSPIFERFFHFLPDKLGIRSIVSATLATQVFVLPFILYNMGTVSLIAPLSNLLVLIAVPAAMLLGFIAGLTSFVSGIVALPFVFVTEVVLGYMLTVVQVFARVPFAEVSVKLFPLWATGVLYVLIAGFIMWFHALNKAKPEGVGLKTD